MLGHRGCRLGMTAPEIYDMQVEAIARAACVRTRAGDHVEAEIMVPLVGAEQEMIRLRERIAATVERVLGEEKLTLPIAIGTMIEVPRAALIAAKIAVHADFFSFGTNDLTQMTYGYSRDDIGRFLPQYLESKVLPYDPFARLDDEGVGQLVRLACESGRQARADLHVGVCGEHGGDPDSIHFFDGVGLDYVSCSPYRVPVARLAAAQASLAREPPAAAMVERAAAAPRRTTPAKLRPRRAAAAGRSVSRQAGKSRTEKGRTPASARRPARAASPRPASGADPTTGASRTSRAVASGRGSAARRPAAVAAPRKPPKAARPAGRAAARAASGPARSRSGAGPRKPARSRSGAAPAKSRGIAARIRRSTARKAVTAAAGKAPRAAGGRPAKAATGRAARAVTGRAAKAATGRAAKATGRAGRTATGRTTRAATTGKAAKGSRSSSGAARRRRPGKRPRR